MGEVRTTSFLLGQWGRHGGFVPYLRRPIRCRSGRIGLGEHLFAAGGSCMDPVPFDEKRGVGASLMFQPFARVDDQQVSEPKVTSSAPIQKFTPGRIARITLELSTDRTGAK